jgi:hypothetical protein
MNFQTLNKTRIRCLVAPQKALDHGLRVDILAPNTSNTYDNGFRKYIAEANKGIIFFYI